MIAVKKPSPNFNSRPAGTAIDTIVLHSDADKRVSQSITYCQDPKSKVSYHAVVGRFGDAYQLVDWDKRAWQAGVSEFDGRKNVNDFSIGLCFGNLNDGIEPIREDQYIRMAQIITELMKLYPAITLDRITTHREIARPVGRKTDPHPRTFDRAKLISLIGK